ncbi:helix-turn-helix domain-containing protein [Sphingomonas sp.]|uniref:AraC family transcriptional regulator n=1 Tax=Sphingomonas sp. TaxID=28214 RepID=UPI00257FA134|nr:helix-turn-helix domain-containing protein [Sphingomonas sp.]
MSPARICAALSHSAGSQAGIHVFLPLATLRLLLGMPMHEIADRVVPLDAILGRAARELGDALAAADGRDHRIDLLDEALRRRLHGIEPPNGQQHHALRLLRARPDLDISAIATEIGWSRKHMADRVRDAIGVGPRAFRRLLRFQTLTGLIAQEADRPDWAGLAAEAGYFDQSHMIREFREFSGLSPTAYLARSLPEGGGLVEA